MTERDLVADVPKPLHHTSPSQAGTFTRCNRLWFIESILGIKTPSDASQWLGTEVHAVAEAWGKSGFFLPVKLDVKQPDGTTKAVPVSADALLIAKTLDAIKDKLPPTGTAFQELSLVEGAPVAGSRPEAVHRMCGECLAPAPCLYHLDVPSRAFPARPTLTRGGSGVPEWGYIDVLWFYYDGEQWVAYILDYKTKSSKR